jgi:amino acid transporter
MRKLVGKGSFGLWTLVALVVGNAIGAGIYTTSGFALANLGSREWVLLAWAVGGLIALTGAISYGMLAERLTESGGEFLYLTRSIHPFAGFIAGWISLLAGFSGAIAFAATTFEVYLQSAIPSLVLFPADSLAVAAILFAGLIHVVRVDTGTTIHNLIVGIMVLALVYVCLFAGIGLISESWSPSAAGSYTESFNVSAFASSLVWISLSYSGFNAAVYVAGEASNAKLNVPSSMIIGTLIIIVLYVAVNAVLLYAPLPGDIVGQAKFAAIAAHSLGGETLGIFIEIIVTISLLTSVTAMVLAGPRVYAKMAEEGLMPRLLRFKKGAPPHTAIILQVIVAVAITLISELRELLSYLSFTLSISLALTVSTLFVRHIQLGERPNSKLYPIAPLLFVVATLWFAYLSSRSNQSQLIAFLATIAIGAIAYLGTRLSRPSPDKSDIT